MPRPAKAFRSAKKALHALYDELPGLDCKGLCQASCGKVGEAVAPLEADLIGAHMQAMGMEAPEDDPASKACPLLTAHGTCSVHAERPLICRLWGVVADELMVCPWGCKPKRYMSNEETRAAYRKLQRISQRYEEEMKPDGESGEGQGDAD